MRKGLKRAMVVLVTGSLLAAAAPAAFASPDGSSKDGVHKSGTCHGHKWTLQLQNHSNGKLEADYELRTGSAGQTWKVVMKDNGSRFFHGNLTTGSDGSLSVDKFVKNKSGKDTVTVKATNTSSGTACSASASIS